MKTLTIEATCEGETFHAFLPCAKIDEALARWQGLLAAEPESDWAKTSRNIVVGAMRSNAHRQSTGAEIVSLALLWLLANGSQGKMAMPFVRRGGVTVIYEITRLQGLNYNFRTTFDQATREAMVAVARGT